MVRWKQLVPYALLTAVGIVLAIAFLADHLKPRPDPYGCVIVHQRKDGSCPPDYISEKELFKEEALPGQANQVYSPHFTEADGTKEDACMDLRRSTKGVGLEKELCTDFLRPGEKEGDSWLYHVSF
jgi:hypothetical protein